jgi:hypothetical protein
MSVKMKRNLTLPDDVKQAFDSMLGAGKARNAYMRVLRDKGWTLQAISEAVGDITRERVRQCIESMSSEDAVTILSSQTTSPPVPEIPDKPERPSPAPRPMPSEATLQRLFELKPLAAQVRYAHKQYRDEAEEYVSLLWHAHTVEGVSVYRLGKLLGVLPCGIESRFVRYGYKETSGTSVAFSPIRYRKSAATK